MTPDHWDARGIQGLRRRLDHAIAARARELGVNPQGLRKRVAFGIFLERVFTRAPERWMLLGANALVARTDGGRFTSDVDLGTMDPTLDVEREIADLRACCSADDSSPFRITVTPKRRARAVGPNGYGGATASAHVEILLGAKAVDSFGIDLSPWRHTRGTPDLQTLPRVVDLPEIPAAPVVPIIPVASHVADKVCAMYEPHRGGPSNRMHDLSDLLRMVRHLSIDAAATSTALRHEAGRRQITLPIRMQSPGGTWARDFPRKAATYVGHPANLRDLEACLAAVGVCLDPVLDGTRTTGMWDPAGQRWEDPA